MCAWMECSCTATSWLPGAPPPLLDWMSAVSALTALVEVLLPAFTRDLHDSYSTATLEQRGMCTN